MSAKNRISNINYSIMHDIWYAPKRELSPVAMLLFATPKERHQSVNL